MQLLPSEPHEQPQHPRISASTLRTPLSAQLCSEGLAWSPASLVIFLMFLIVWLTKASHSS